MFTDTANYTGIIPECTNLSVGYSNEHSVAESQSVAFLLDLRDKLLALDTDKLPIVRDPSESDIPASWASYSYGGNSYSRNFRRDYDTASFRREPIFDQEEKVTSDDYDLVDMVRDFPNEVADYLEHMGAEDDIREYIAAALNR